MGKINVQWRDDDLPIPVILASILIVLSALFPFVDSYYFRIQDSDIFEAPYVLWMVDFVWLLFMSWIAWRITKRIDWRSGMLAISVVSLALGVVEVFEYGLMVYQLSYLLEATTLFIAWCLLRGEFFDNWFLPAKAYNQFIKHRSGQK